MDTETMRVFNTKLRKWIQIPVLFTFAYYNDNNKLINFYSIINIRTVLIKGIDFAVKELLN
jgi:hypothetical protein